MRAPRRREIYEAILHRLQHPTANTVEEAAMGLTEDVIAAIVEMPDDPPPEAIFPAPQTPLSVVLKGRIVAVTLDGSERDDTFPVFDRVEKAALLALLHHATMSLDPPRPRANGGIIQPGGYIAPGGVLARHGKDPYGLDSGIGGE